MRVSVPVRYRACTPNSTAEIEHNTAVSSKPGVVPASAAGRNGTWFGCQIQSDRNSWVVQVGRKPPRLLAQMPAKDRRAEHRIQDIMSVATLAQGMGLHSSSGLSGSHNQRTLHLAQHS